MQRFLLKIVVLTSIGFTLLSGQLWAFSIWPQRIELAGLLEKPLQPVDIAPIVFIPSCSDSYDYAVYWANNKNVPWTKSLGAVYLSDDEDKILSQFNFPNPVTRVKGLDINRDRCNELLVSWCGDTSAGMKILDLKTNQTISEFIIRESDFEWRSNDHWDVIIMPETVIQIDENGRLGLLLSLNCGWAHMPSGLVMIDPSTGIEIWHYWIASGAKPIAVSKAFSPNPIIVMGTNASANGATFQGTSDNVAYLVGLDMNGSEIWRMQTEGTFGQYTIGTVSDTDTCVMMAYYSSLHPQANQDRLFTFNPHTGQVIKERLMEPHNSRGNLLQWRRDASGRRMFVLNHATDIVEIVDADLNLTRQSKAPYSIQRTRFISGVNQWMLLGKDLKGNVVILDEQFKTWGKYAIEGSVLGLQRHRKAELPHLWIYGANTAYCLSMTLNNNYWLDAIIRVIGAVLLLFSGTWGFRTVIRARRQIKRVRKEQLQNEAWALMASKMAHDIRTPLSVLRLESQNLELEIDTKYGGVPNELRHYFETFSRESDRMSQVATGFMKFARLTPPNLELTNLGSLIKETVERSPHSREVAITVDIEPHLPLVLVDCQQTVNMIENIISNSLKAIKEKGRILISLRKARVLPERGSKEAWLELTVEDTGRGIPAQDLLRIFEPYFSRSEGGTGLGLAIVKKTVEDHHGRINVSSTVNAGTTFTILFPIPEEIRDGN